MDAKIYNLILKILDSDLPKDTKDEIVRFYTLPRNTPVKPKLEMPESPKELGTVKRPSHRDLERKKNPVAAAEEEEMKKTLEGRVETG